MSDLNESMALHRLDAKVWGTSSNPLMMPRPWDSQRAAMAGNAATARQVNAIETMMAELNIALWEVSAFCGDGFAGIDKLSSHSASVVISWLRDSWQAQESDEQATKSAFQAWLRRRWGMNRSDWQVGP